MDGGGEEDDGVIGTGRESRRFFGGVRYGSLGRFFWGGESDPIQIPVFWMMDVVYYLRYLSIAERLSWGFFSPAFLII